MNKEEAIRFVMDNMDENKVTKVKLDWEERWWKNAWGRTQSDVYPILTVETKNE